MSTSLNSMTGVIWEDLVRPHLKWPVSEHRASQLLKLLVVLIGASCVGLVFLVERMGAALVQVRYAYAGKHPRAREFSGLCLIRCWYDCLCFRRVR